MLTLDVDNYVDCRVLIIICVIRLMMLKKVGYSIKVFVLGDRNKFLVPMG